METPRRAIGQQCRPSAAPRSLRNALALVAAASLAALAQSPGAVAATPNAPVASCASIAGWSFPGTQILSATEMPATSSMPAYCSVVGVIDKRVSTQDPDHFTYGIGFRINLPDSWIGRFEMQGGGGTDGSLGAATGSAGVELSQGWAVAADDGGHEDPLPSTATNPTGNPFSWSDDDANAGGSAHFGVDEKARTDYGYNGIAKTTELAKAIIERYYGRPPEHSYLYGCSNGGRDGMSAVHRLPDAFDGIVSGNPGFDLPRAALAEVWNEQSLAPLATRFDANNQPYIPDTFPPQDLEVVSAAILGACDALDGLVDGIVDNFEACTNARVYPALDAYTCKPGGAHGNAPHGGSCITAAQVSALKRIFNGAHTSDGERVYSSWYWDAGIWDPLPPSPYFGAGFWLWNVGFPGDPTTQANDAINLTLGAGAVPMVFITPPHVTPVSGTQGQEAYIFAFDFDRDASRIFATAPGYPESSMDFMTGTPQGPSLDLRPFAHHGGKLIIYSSVNDGIFSGVDIVDWYNAMNRDTGGDADRFARLFMIPNMAHCGGGPATTSFATNMLSAITAWVEQGTAPDRIVAANMNTVSPFPSGNSESTPLFDPRVAQNFPVGGTRPLCPYPQQSRYKGSGPTNDAASFACVKVKRRGDDGESDAGESDAGDKEDNNH